MSGKAAFFDVAGTIITGNPWRYVLSHPSLPRNQVRLAYIPLFSWYGLKKAKLISDTRFRHHWIKGVAGLFKGWTQTQLDELFGGIVEASREAGEFVDPLVAQIAQHRQDGVKVVLISGLFDRFVGAYAAAVGADAGIGSPLGFDGDRCTGKITGATIGGPTKLDAIRAYLAREGLSTELSEHFAYADSFSDVPMLSSVGSPVATNPEPELREVAVQRGWPIIDT
jgi:HAD superfamily phosphoserine phosphatase-like hydrolase